MDFVDLCTNPFALPDLVKLAAAHRVPVISQKPMAPSVANGGRTTVTCEMGHPESCYEQDAFPQTLVFVEGDRGTADGGSPGRVLAPCLQRGAGRLCE